MNVFRQKKWPEDKRLEGGGETEEKGEMKWKESRAAEVHCCINELDSEEKERMKTEGIGFTNRKQHADKKRLHAGE
mgnify:CR=1 FL=1